MSYLMTAPIKNAPFLSKIVSRYLLKQKSSSPYLSRPLRNTAPFVSNLKNSDPLNVVDEVGVKNHKCDLCDKYFGNTETLNIN